MKSLKNYGTWYTLRIPDEQDEDGYKLVIAVTTSFLGFTNTISENKSSVEIKPTFMSVPLNELSDWLEYMFKTDILFIDADDDILQLRYCGDDEISEPVEIYDKIVYYIEGDVVKTLHLSDEEFESMIVSEIGENNG